MNAFEDMPGEEERDWLLFRYLEGELTEEEAAQVRSRLAQDEAWQGEMDLWKEAHVEQAFYPVADLEKSLVRPRIWSFPSGISFLFTGMLTTLLSFLPPVSPAPSVSIPQPESVPFTASTKVKVEENTDNGLVVNEIKKSRSSPKVRIKRSEPEEHKPILNQEVVPAITVSDFGSLETRTVLLSRDTLNQVVLLLKQVPAEIPIPQPVANRAISRKQERLLEKRREEARQKREAERFIRGKEPYVVPLNPNF